MFRVHHNSLPTNIQKHFSTYQSVYYLRSDEDRNFSIPKFRTTMKSFCVSVAGVKLWNDLSLDLKQCSSMKIFKKKYKDLIFMENEKNNLC